MFYRKWVGSETFFFGLKTADTRSNGVCFYLNSHILFALTTVKFIALLSYAYAETTDL